MSFSQVLGNALDGMELEDDAKNIPQVFSKLYLHLFLTSFVSQIESPTKMKEEEKSEVVGHVTKALTDHFNAHHRLAIHHFAEGSEEESEAEEEEMETDSPSKPDSMPAVDTSNLQLAWEMLELAKVKGFICFRRLLYHVVGDLREEGQGCGSGEEEGKRKERFLQW